MIDNTETRLEKAMDAIEDTAEKGAINLRTEVKSFCMQTSIKGVPRAIKSTNKKLKFVWILGVLVLLGICIWQVYITIIYFFSYPKATVIEERLIGGRLHQENLDVFFPAITVCNLQPLVSNHMEIAVNKSIPTLDHYFYYLGSMAFAGRSDIVQLLLSNGLYAGYYEFIGEEAAKLLGHQKESFIMMCFILTATGHIRGRVPCEEIGKITPVHSPEYYNCYTIEYLQDSETSTLAYGMSIILYLDNFMFPIPDLKGFTPSLIAFESAGARVFLHGNNTLYDKQTESFPVGPGWNTDVQVRPISHYRLGPPHGNCTTVPEIHIYDKNGNSKSFAFQSCTRACLAGMVVEDCGCTIPDYLEQPWETKPPGILNCNSATNVTLDELMNRTLCQKNIQATRVTDCLDHCSFPCREVEFQRDLLPTRWPARSSVLSFYDVMIYKKPYEDKFDTYKTIKFLAANASTRAQALELLEKTTLIQDNFAKIDVFLASFTVLTMIDSPKMSVTDLFSSLGGTLNLYSGITFVVIIELVELLYMLIFRCKEKKKLKQINKVHVINVQSTKRSNIYPSDDIWQTKYNNSWATADIHR